MVDMMNSNNQYVKQVETIIEINFFLLNNQKYLIHTCIRPCDNGSFSSLISPIGEDI